MNEPRPVAFSPRLLTVPNVLGLVRLMGSLLLFGLAWSGWDRTFFWLMLLLLMTDWIDGKLAIWLNQRTEFGAKLDSRADATLYAAILFGAILLQRERIQPEWVWIAAGVGTYALSCVAAYAKFGKLPSYHTRLAKLSWALITVAALCVFANGPVWPLRWALTGVTLANLESLLITWRLDHWQADVGSLWRVWRQPRV